MENSERPDDPCHEYAVTNANTVVNTIGGDFCEEYKYFYSICDTYGAGAVMDVLIL